MSIKFPTRRPDAGEIAHPDDLNLNFKEFVDELNGNIDSDNLRDPETGDRIEKDCFAVGSFSECFQSSFDAVDSSGSRFQCSHSTTGFISKDDNGVQLPFVEFDAESDGWIIVDFAVSHIWEGNGFVSEDEAKTFMKVGNEHFHPFQGYSSPDDILGNPLHDPPGGWLAASGSSTTGLDNSVGPIGSYSPLGYFDPDEADKVFKHKNYPQGRWIAKPIDRYAVQYKVEVNGNDISESGWLFNGNQRQGVYLCGCIPVVAGKNKVVVSVRAVSHFELKASTLGIGAVFDDEVGKYTPKQTEVTLDGTSPLPDRTEISSSSFSIPSSQNPSKIKIGIDCFIQSSNLVIQYRKA
tara:strand:+ start:41 stop:1093 length:1053 start_codon:yes stop_codon:yes gene_type:complete